MTNGHLPEFRKAAGVFGDWLAWGLLQCTGRPVEGHAPSVDVTADGAGPVLVIGTTGDPAPPYEGAEKMAARPRGQRPEMAAAA